MTANSKSAVFRFKGNCRVIYLKALGDLTKCLEAPSSVQLLTGSTKFYHLLKGVNIISQCTLG